MRLVLLLSLAVSPAVSATFEELFRSGLLALQRGELSSAQTDLEQAAQLQPENGRLWVALAQTYSKEHESGKANESAAKALTLAGGDAVVLRTLAVYYAESGQTLKAAQAQAAYAKDRPGDEEAKERAASLYFEAAKPMLEREQFQEAVSILQSSAGSIGPNAQIELALGVAFYGQRRFREAGDAFLGAIELAPQERQPYVFLGRMLDQIPERLPEVTQLFIVFEKAHPEDYEGFLLHARALDAQRLEPDTARRLLEKAIALNDSDAAAHTELGALLDRQQQFAAAAAQFEKAAALAPSDPATHYRLSRLYERLNKPQAAAAERERHRALVAGQNVAQ